MVFFFSLMKQWFDHICIIIQAQILFVLTLSCSCLCVVLFVGDDAFSTGTGLERAGLAGPVHRFWTSGSSAKTRNIKGSAGDRLLPL